jgi:hypothetical protein
MKFLLACVLLTSAAALGQEPAPPVPPGRALPKVQVLGSLDLTGRLPERLDPLPEQSREGTKSPALAVAYSLLLPGMGELYAGDYSTGKYLTAAEGALVVGLISFDRYANWLKDDSRQYSVQHAHTVLAGKDDQYFSDIGDFGSVYDYNAFVLRNRQPQKVYDPNSSDYWKWDNPANQENYRSIRVSSDDRFNDTRFIVAAMAVNHLISAINAARLVIRHNKSVEEGELIDIHADVTGGLLHPDGIRVTVSRSF